MEADRPRTVRLPEDVVLEDPHAALAREPSGEPAPAFGEHLRCHDRVRLPRVAELAGEVFGVAAGRPVHFVGADPRLVPAVEQRLVSLAKQLEPADGDEAFVDDQEAVAPERPDLLGGERLDQDRGRVFSGS